MSGASQMGCSEVLPRLVAWQDGELSPSESTQVREHVAGCTACARAHHKLAITMPLPTPPAPAAVRRRLDRALDVDWILAEAARPPEPEPAPQGWPTRLALALSQRSSIPLGALLAYLALLAATFGWGASNWWALHRTGDPPAAAQTVPTAGAIPAHQFRPAAYDPEADPRPLSAPEEPADP